MNTLSPAATPIASAASPEPALAELVQLGLMVARAAARLADVEGRAAEALGVAAEAAARAVAGPHETLSAAMAAGRDADANDAARDGIAARLVSLTDSFEKAARAVRRSVALQARLAEGRPFRAPTAREAGAARGLRVVATADDAERAERGDAPEWGDEIAGQTDAEVMRGIHRDLGRAAGAAATLPAGDADAAAQPDGMVQVDAAVGQDGPGCAPTKAGALPTPKTG